MLTFNAFGQLTAKKGEAGHLRSNTLKAPAEVSMPPESGIALPRRTEQSSTQVGQ